MKLISTSKNKPNLYSAQEFDSDDGPLWTAEDAAEYLRLKPSTVRKMAREGELPAIRLKRSWRFRKVDIYHYILINTPNLMS